MRICPSKLVGVTLIGQKDRATTVDVRHSAAVEDRLIVFTIRFIDEGD